MAKIFDFGFLNNLIIFKCFKHDLTIFDNCLSVCRVPLYVPVYDMNFDVVLSQELTQKISQNFIFSCTLR